MSDRRSDPSADGAPRGDEPPLADVTGMLAADDPFDAELSRWAAAARADHAAGSRARERWLRQAATEEASLVGVLADVAERSLAVAVQTMGRRSHSGVIAAVGRDFCVLRTGGGREVLIALRALTWMRVEAGARAPVGDRTLPSGLGLGEALVAMTGDRPCVHVVTASGDGLRGEVRSVGRDVLTLALDGDDRPTAYVPLAAVAEVTLA